MRSAAWNPAADSSDFTSGGMGHYRSADRCLSCEFVRLPASRCSSCTTHRSFAQTSIARRVHSVGVLAYKTSKVAIINLKLIIHEILEDYVLPIGGDHGVCVLWLARGNTREIVATKEIAYT